MVNLGNLKDIINFWLLYMYICTCTCKISVTSNGSHIPHFRSQKTLKNGNTCTYIRVNTCFFPVFSTVSLNPMGGVHNCIWLCIQKDMLDMSRLQAAKELVKLNTYTGLFKERLTFKTCKISG